MVNPARIAGQLKRWHEAELEALACEIEARAANREFECKTIPKQKRGRNIHRTPKTALISLAAQRTYLKRQIVEALEMRFCFTDSLAEDVQDLEEIKKILARSANGPFRGTSEEAA